MSDDHVPADGENRSTLQALMATPVGRRWVLKAGLRSAAAAVVGLRFAPTAAAWATTATPAESAASPTALQFALGAAGDVTDLVLVANGARIPLVAHTAASRAALIADGGLWAAIDLSVLTHYVPAVALPASQGVLVSVQGSRSRGTERVLVSQMMYAPPEATMALATAAVGFGGSLATMVGSAQRLKTLGIGASQVRSPADVVQLDTVGDTHQTAIALTMCHPNVSTVDPMNVAATKSLLSQTPAVETLGAYIATMQQQGKDFATMVQATDKDGTPSQIKVGTTTTTFSTIKLNLQDTTFASTTKAAVSSGIVGVRDSPALGSVITKPLDQDRSASTGTWVQPQGVAPQARAYAPATADAGVDIKVKNTGLLSGTYTEVTGGYANGKVPVRIYNNYVRWMWAYVQYLGAGGKNLSIDSSASLPDTQYAKSLALVPQVFTVLGIPLWDTNTVDVTLNFPAGAHTARLLYCGLGADIYGGGWRQYFPADAYPDRVAPTAEVEFPAMITGILTIGLNVFALATDIAIATVWGGINKLVTAGIAGAAGAAFILEVEQGLVSALAVLTGAEAAAASILTAGATYADAKNSGDDVSNIWSILLGLASVIPKVLFNPANAQFWANAATYITSGEIASKVIDAIPIIGEVVAIASVAGDVATLAEVCAETIVSPWVIENEVTLTYQATVTIAHDPSAAGFPATATSWRLEALVDGALTLDPITGTINAGGRIQSDPLVLSVVAPFGGTNIQWSIVMLDAGGNQVGTGVSGLFPNDDPAKPPTTVSFAITELPATITASSVFERADTTTYDQQAGGYSWSNTVTVTGTVASGGIQEVTGVTVATTAGVAGIVWKQADRYYVRGVPLTENGNTIKLGAATKEGYARRPFLLFDAFVARADQGNHVLVEPDETTDAYHVRKVSLDSVTGAPTWDSTVSHGTFILPVSAAALHSSGRVLALHTDSGRLGWLQPVDTPRPQLAAYSAGPGTQVGLLQSPVAVAVTNPGVVLVLEAGASRLASFDLNGNPMAYFGDGATRKYTAPLVSAGTYLDLAVDGVGQIYVLYYTGDGSTPGDYRVDVYTSQGVALDTRSPGVNVAHLAVDYWRSIYGANYGPLTDEGTSTPHIDAALGVAEPSLSRFDPTQPSTSATSAPRRAKRRSGR